MGDVTLVGDRVMLHGATPLVRRRFNRNGASSLSACAVAIVTPVF